MSKTEQIRTLFTEILNGITVLDQSEEHSQEVFLKMSEIAACAGILLSIEEILFEALETIEESGNE
jgi:hypothetical protein